MFDEDEIISKLNEEKNLNEVAQELNISVLEAHKKIMALKNGGMVFKKIIYDDGNINYYIKRFPDFYKTNTD